VLELIVGAVIYAAGWATFGLLSHFFPGYLAEKGKNLATKEDIDELTHKVEAIRTDYAMIVERFRATSQFRLAALDRRLQAAQEAFALWRKLISKINSEDLQTIVIQCQEWFDNNSLYLSAEARQAFHEACQRALMHRQLKRRDVVSMMDNWRKIEEAGGIIVLSVELPPIRDGEAQDVAAPTPPLN
jgi:hypothetical protein